MGTVVQRPEASAKKVNCRDDFELCYIRHQYFRKAGYNPSEDEMLPYKWIVDRQARKTYNMYRGLFSLAGMELDDVANIGMVHLTSFLGLFSLDRLSENKYNDAWLKIKDHNDGVIPDSDDIKNKDKANFTLFIKQRMEDLVRVCRQKAKNIKGFPVEEIQIFYGPRRPPRNLLRLLENHRRYGFKKMDIGVFKTVKKKLKRRPKGPTFRFESVYYVVLPLENKNISEQDLSGAGMDLKDSIHNMDPEQILFHKQEEALWEERRVYFDNQPKAEKMDILVKFIEANQGKEGFEDELMAAKRALKTLERSDV